MVRFKKLPQFYPGSLFLNGVAHHGLGSTLTSFQLLLSLSLEGRPLLSPPSSSFCMERRCFTQPQAHRGGENQIIWVCPGASNDSFGNPQTPGETALSFTSPFPNPGKTQVEAQLPISTPENHSWRKLPSEQRCLNAVTRNQGSPTQPRIPQLSAEPLQTQRCFPPPPSPEAFPHG